MNCGQQVYAGNDRRSGRMHRAIPPARICILRCVTTAPVKIHGICSLRPKRLPFPYARFLPHGNRGRNRQSITHEFLQTILAVSLRDAEEPEPTRLWLSIWETITHIGLRAPVMRYAGHLLILLVVAIAAWLARSSILEMLPAQIRINPTSAAPTPAWSSSRPPPCRLPREPMRALGSAGR